MRNPMHYLLTVLGIFCATIVVAQCPTGNFNLTTQAEVDALAENYRNCTSLNVIKNIGPSTDIKDLSPFEKITSVHDDFTIIGNDSLTSLEGLHHITSTGNIHLTTAI